MVVVGSRLFLIYLTCYLHSTELYYVIGVFFKFCFENRGYIFNNLRSQLIQIRLKKASAHLVSVFRHLTCRIAVLIWSINI